MLLETEDDIQRLRSEYGLLIAQKEALEIEADTITYELQSPGPNGQPPSGLTSPLIDEEGFPRADINIYDVKNKRQRLRVINTGNVYFGSSTLSLFILRFRP
jgi:hypothetical protein